MAAVQRGLSAYGYAVVTSRVLGGGRDPHGRAGLTTHFVTGCVLAFPTVYRTWRHDFDHPVDEVAAWLGTPPGPVRGALRPMREGREKLDQEGGADD